MARFAPAISSAKALKSPRAIAPKHRPLPRASDRAEGAIAIAPATTAHAPPLQAKLEIGEPNDEFEKEADQVADHVMRMTDGAAAPPEPPAPTRTASAMLLQRACAKCEQEDEKLQREVAPGAATAMAGPAPAGFVNHLATARASGGTALPSTVRSFMEPRFGQDFSHVRVHQDARANQLARSVQARAFTIGRDLFFRQGEFQPSSNGGRRLIAHELTHVLQQKAALAPRTQIRDEQVVRVALTDQRNGAVHPTSASASKRVQRAVSKVCNPPSAWFALGASVNPLLVPSAILAASAFGAIAETFISSDVIAKNGVAPGNFYLDNPLAGPIDPRYVAFLIRKNPGLSPFAIAGLSALTPVRPDVVMHQPGLAEFEEVKPDSPNGRYAGRVKVRALNAFYGGFSLPYVAGATYVPMAPYVIASGSVNGIPIIITFEVTRDRTGLLVYDICVETDWMKVAELALEIAVLIILALLLRRGMGRLPLPPQPVPTFASARDAASDPSRLPAGSPLRSASRA